jgi:hypothetical protein
MPLSRSAIRIAYLADDLSEDVREHFAAQMREAIRVQEETMRKRVAAEARGRSIRPRTGIATPLRTSR